MKRRVVPLLVVLCVALVAGGGYALFRYAKSEPYAFFVAGHTYGVPDTESSGIYPLFKAQFPQLQESGADFGVLTGDVVIHGSAGEWDDVDADLAELEMPIYFAVGNHDMRDRERFTARYGPTYHSLEYQGDLFIFLDSELTTGTIQGAQLDFLKDTLASGSPRNIFIFIHRLLWVIEDSPYWVLIPQVNNVMEYDFHNDFWTRVVPLLEETGAPVYVIAGDVGVPTRMSLFYNEVQNVHLIASGMGGSEEENYLLFKVSAGGAVQIDARRLDGRPLNLSMLAAYNLDYYTNP